MARFIAPFSDGLWMQFASSHSFTFQLLGFLFLLTVRKSIKISMRMMRIVIQRTRVALYRIRGFSELPGGYTEDAF